MAAPYVAGPRFELIVGHWLVVVVVVAAADDVPVVVVGPVVVVEPVVVVAAGCGWENPGENWYGLIH